MKHAMRILSLLLVLIMLSGCASAPIQSSISVMPSPATTATPSPAPSAGTATPTPSPSPTPAPTPTEKPVLDYTYNPYVLPSDVLAFLGGNTGQYQRLVDGILARQEIIEFEKGTEISDVLSSVYASFPLSVLIADFAIDQEQGKLSLVYRYDAATHEQTAAAFQSRVTEVIRTTIQPEYNQFERLLALYRFTAQSIEYMDGDDVSAYNALMNGVGICQSYTGVLSFLLLQVGIDSLSANAFMTNDDAHVWIMVKLDGAWYHFDPTFESSQNEGAGLCYFGMDDSQRTGTGIVMPIGTGVDSWYNSTAPACTDDRFLLFANVKRWELDSETHRLSLYYTPDGQPDCFDTEKLAFCP